MDISIEKSLIKADFDRIALVGGCGWNHNDHYHGYLLRHLPARCGSCLDAGCGTGTFTRLLAAKSGKAIGIDFSEEMIKRAKAESAGMGNVDYLAADILEYDCVPGEYDVIASIATLHHLPMDVFFKKAAEWLKGGGVLLILDLYKGSTISDYLLNLAAIPANRMMMLMKKGISGYGKEEKLAWCEHGKHEEYATMKEIKGICARLLPGAKVKRHLFWRYSIVWTNQG